MNLSAYVEFSVVLDYTSGSAELRLIDTSSYPGGVPQLVSGSVQIVQPDGLTTQGLGDDVYWNGSQLTIAQKELRKSYKQQPQNGTYVVTYTVRAAGYEDTECIKTFELSYKEPAIAITKSLNIFTPSLSLIDTTDYTQSGLLLQSVAREWDVIVGSVGMTGGTAQTISLDIAGNFYDAAYTSILVSTIEYDIAETSWVTILDKAIKTIEFTANTPPTIPELRHGLVILKEGTETCEPDMDAYLEASAIFNQFLDRGRMSDFTGLEGYVQKLLKLFNNNVTPTYINTNEIIEAYDWESAAPGSVDWSEIVNRPIPVEIMFKVGQEGFPIDGSNTYTNSLLANRALMVTRNSLPQWSSNPGDGNSYYEKLYSSSTMIFYGSLSDGEAIHIIAL